MTKRIPARAPIGTQAISRLRRSSANITKPPSIMPARGVLPPLVILTSVGPIVPAPGIPPTRKEAMFPIPCPISSRSEWCLLRVRASRPTHVLRVSIESNTDSVRAGTIIICKEAAVTEKSEAARPTTASKNDPDVWIWPITRGLFCKTSNLSEKRASTKYERMPPKSPIMAAGTFLVRRGAVVMSPMVTTPTARPSHCHNSGDARP